MTDQTDTTVTEPEADFLGDDVTTVKTEPTEDAQDEADTDDGPDAQADDGDMLDATEPELEPDSSNVSPDPEIDDATAARHTAIGYPAGSQIEQG